jgi:transposase
VENQDPKEANVMLYVGIDVHKKNLQVCVVDGEGNRISDCRLANELESVYGFFDRIETPAGIALEATHNWGMLYDMLSDLGFDVHICHSKEAKMIGLASVKTDKVDAFKLATLLRVGLLPEAYAPGARSRELRSLVRGRASLIAQSTAVKNQIHAILRANWISSPWTDTFGKSGRKFLEGLDIGASYKLVIVSKLLVLDEIQRQVSVISEEIVRQAHLDVRAMLVTTIPGIAEFRAVMLLSEIVDISRFKRAESLVCYSGLNPREHSSGEKTRRGKITKEGSSWLRWIFVEAALSVVKEEGKIRDLYLRVCEKKGHNRAIVAAARELVVSVYWMLKRMEPYRASGKKLSIAVASEVG